MQYPILIYDNLCTSCTFYAKIIDRLLMGRITIIGHYTNDGQDLKKTIFPSNYNGLDMSWFVTKKVAYGGREGLKQLIKYLVSTAIIPNKLHYEKNNFDLNQCTTDCRTVKGVMIRSCSILTNGKIIKIK